MSSHDAWPVAGEGEPDDVDGDLEGEELLNLYGLTGDAEGSRPGDTQE